MTESSFPITGQDITESQFSQVGSAQGNGILDDWGRPYSLTLNDSDQTATISVSTVSGVARAVVGGYGHKIDAPVKLSLPTVSSTTNYHIGFLLDPANQGAAAGPVRLTVLTSVNLTAGQVWCPLYTVTRTTTGSLSASKVVHYRTVVCPVVMFPTRADLLNSDPSQFMWGTVAITADFGDMYQAQGDVLAEADWYSLNNGASAHNNRGSNNSTANFGSGNMVYMTSVTIPQAPTGEYLVYGNIKALCSVDNNATVRITAASSTGASANPVPDNLHRFVGTYTDAFMQGLYYHTSGDLTVSIYCQMVTGTGTVVAAGTYAGAVRVGISF